MAHKFTSLGISYASLFRYQAMILHDKCKPRVEPNNDKRVGWFGGDDYFLHSNFPTNLCYIDASKAFDRTNFYNLFHGLIDRSVPVILVRAFMAWYCSQEFVVRWGNCFSTTFTTSNGVRQGGIFSPLFFNVYMNKLSSTLNDAKVGCVMNGVYINDLMYADDLVLIAPSVRALQVLLRYCDNFAKDNDVKYNAKKTVCMFVRPKELKSDFV